MPKKDLALTTKTCKKDCLKSLQWNIFFYAAIKAIASGGINRVGRLDAEKGDEPDGTEAGGDKVEDAGT